MCYDKLSLILFIIVILLYIHLLKLQSSFAKLSNINKKYKLSNNEINNVYGTLGKINDIFNKNNIFYVIEKELLLKVIRQEEIKYNTDVQSIFVWRKDKNKILDVLKDLNITDKSTHLEIKLNNTLSLHLNMYIEPSANNNDNRVLQCGEDACSSYREYNFRIENLEPRRIYNYPTETKYQLQLWGANDTKEYIENMFGTNALNTYTYDDVNESYYDYKVPEVYNLYNKLYEGR